MTNTNKNLVYKIAQFKNDLDKVTLQDLIVRALNKRKTALSRQQSADDAIDHFRLVNFHGKHAGISVGDFFDYTKGHSQPQATFKDDAEELEITALKPEKGKDFLHSILYYGIYKNSVILSQAMTLRAKQFEEYLNWLLRETKVISDDNYIYLCDYPPAEMQGRISSAKKIEFKAPVDFTPVEGKNKGSNQSLSYEAGNLGWDLLQKILPAEYRLPSVFKAKDILEESNLNVTLLVSWTRQKANDSTSLLDGISNSLRHVESEIDYTIHTKSGQISRDQVKLKRTISVSVQRNGLVSRSDMWIKMDEWFRILIADERIPS